MKNHLWTRQLIKISYHAISCCHQKILDKNSTHFHFFSPNFKSFRSAGLVFGSAGLGQALHNLNWVTSGPNVKLNKFYFVLNQDVTVTVKRDCGIQRVDVKKRSGRGNLTFSIILCERFYVQFLHFMELDLVCFISIDFLHQRQHLYRGGHSLHSLYSGLPHSHNLVLGHNHISCVLRPESWGEEVFSKYTWERRILVILRILIIWEYS